LKAAACSLVVPAQAGIHQSVQSIAKEDLDSGLRRNDGREIEFQSLE